MIVSLHVATGAAVGALTGSRAAALALGPVVHVLGDRMPHRDFRSHGFELASGIAAVAFLALRRGPLDAATLGGIAASLPDAEHRFRLPRPGGRKLFPSHRFTGWHRPDGASAWAQLVVAAAILGWLAAGRGRAVDG